MVSSLYEQALSALKSGGIEDSSFEADVLFEEIFGRDFRLKLLTGQLDRPETEAEAGKLHEMLERRLSGEPLQYIVGRWDFYRGEFSVGEGVLIPRQDTETLVESAFALVKGIKNPRILDLCAGTGCIAITLSELLPDSEVHAVEFYDEAYRYLEKNISEHGSHVIPHKLDVLSEESAKQFTSFDLITCNPPYLTSSDMANLQPEVSHEPETALFGGKDGLDFYRAIPVIWKPAIKAGGYIAFEIGATQGEAVKEILEALGYSDVRIIKDLCGKDRVVTAKLQHVNCVTTGDTL
ncbi:MAG: peptide chain release factor N(5)-glutamine methyltransferase [Oscillospiraceae bacterium]|nr:peptide chain release factor N(5)-glutamine methyltransferase [Oscillospiraceae bacterium]